MKDSLQVNFRMPAALKARLEAAALESGRSLTAEIVHRLSAGFFDQSAESATRQLEDVSEIRRLIQRSPLIRSDDIEAFANTVAAVSEHAKNVATAMNSLLDARMALEAKTEELRPKLENVRLAAAQDLTDKVVKAQAKQHQDVLDASAKIAKRKKGRAK